MDYLLSELYQRYLTTDPTRGSYIKTLECYYGSISTKYLESRTTLPFGEFLSRITSLVELGITFGEQDIHLAPSVLSWVSTLSSLRRVKFYDSVLSDQDTLKLLQQLPNHYCSL